MMQDALKEQPDGIFVATVNREVVGLAIILYKEWFNIAYLDYLLVREDMVRSGIGSKLMQRCIEFAKTKGARIIYTETGKDNQRAINFYRKHGFEITGHIPHYYRENLDAVILTRKTDKQKRTR